MIAPHCPSCGYTEKDAKLHMDHNLCKNAGNAPWEKRKVRTYKAGSGPLRTQPHILFNLDSESTDI